MSLKMEVLSMDIMGELDILGHYCNVLCVGHAKVGILQETGQIVFCSSRRTRTMYTWKHRPYFPTSWVILQTRCDKGHLHIRSSVLFWNWQISWRATIPGQYFRGLFNMPAFKNFFLEALPPVSWSFFRVGSSPTDIDGLTSVAICTNCLVGDDTHDCPISSILLTSSLCLSISPGVGGLLCHPGLLVIPVPEPPFLSWPIALPVWSWSSPFWNGK